MIDLDDQLLKELKPIYDEIRKNEASVCDDDKDHFETGANYPPPKGSGLPSNSSPD